ncbi:MAG: copper amine oxidase N-terminal domain-containing protein [Tissierella sp.]|nr:copper amine oxidase N-terminal domain-containing protein [Tissierella sp.]
MKKKGFVLILALILTMSSSVVFAQNDITVRIDAANVELNEEFGVPFIDENNRTLVPFAATLEAYGADIAWDGATRTAKATKGDITVEVPIGENYIVKNGEKIENDAVAVVEGDRTYLPIRKVMEAFGADVQWDQDLKTVVITPEPFDAKSKIIDAYEKQYAWKNYDMYMLMNMSMAVPDGTGTIQEIDMQMEMNATSFMNPMKLKADGNLIMNIEGNKFLQPLMEMYMVAEENKFIIYTGMMDPNTGDLTWMKQEIEDEGFAELVDPNNEEIQALNEQSIKEVNYLGTYSDGNRNLEKYKVTISFDAFDELMKQSMSMVTNTIADEDLQMSLDLISALEDMTYILYIDESTGEFAKMEMDLSSMLDSMFDQIINTAAMETEIPEGLTEEELEEFNNMFAGLMESMNIKMDIVGEYLNINTAKDFEISEEALNAISMEEYLEGVVEALEELQEVNE